MIEQLTLTNFKCFENEQPFSFRQINVLAGYNGRGKSSVFQALLLMAQSFQKTGDVKQLLVNGNYVDLDLFENLLNCNSERKDFEIKLKSSNPDYHVKLNYKETNIADRIGELDELVVNGTDFFNNKVQAIGSEEPSVIVHRLSPEYPKDFMGLLTDCDYISAFRFGPTKYEEKSDLNRFNPIGKNGEHLLSVLAQNEELQKKASDWLDYIMDGALLEIGGKERSNPVLNLYIKSAFSCNNKIKSINCGFGYSYVLPIVLLAVSKQSGILFMENPEAHLHPKAQSRLMEMVCKELSDKKVQVFIETHSEHIINAVRIQALKPDCALSHKDVAFCFFEKDGRIQPLEMNSKGQLDNWPVGFFDQQEEDISEILRMGLLK